uniref:Uncharacterized protein n=1 Tax=Arundo donax TaxID=35708 RepID=A0A0A9H0E2_ARUDO
MPSIDGFELPYLKPELELLHTCRADLTFRLCPGGLSMHLGSFSVTDPSKLAAGVKSFNLLGENFSGSLYLFERLFYSIRTEAIFG